MLCHGTDVGRERVRARAVDEGGDDDVVDGKRKRQQAACDDTRQKNRQLIWRTFLQIQWLQDL